MRHQIRKRKHQTDEEESAGNYLQKDALYNGIQDSKIESVPDRMVWIFRIGGYKVHLCSTGWLDSQKTPNVFMEELEDAENEDKKPYKPESTEMEGL